MPTFGFRVSSDQRRQSNTRILNKTSVVQVDLLFVFVVEAVCCLLSAGLRAVQLVSDKKIISSRASLYTTR